MQGLIGIQNGSYSGLHIKLIKSRPFLIMKFVFLYVQLLCKTL